jgi:hypothetical protein
MYLPIPGIGKVSLKKIGKIATQTASEAASNSRAY